jgi:hypothetical protein
MLCSPVRHLHVFQRNILSCLSIRQASKHFCIQLASCWLLDLLNSGNRNTTSQWNVREFLLIFSLINDVLQALNDRKLAGGIFCDLTKAFYSINHEILLARMDFYGIWGIFLKLITSYFCNIYQRQIISTIFFRLEADQIGCTTGISFLPIVFLVIYKLSVSWNKWHIEILFICGQY